jgi:hypothetical protein
MSRVGGRREGAFVAKIKEEEGKKVAGSYTELHHMSHFPSINRCIVSLFITLILYVPRGNNTASREKSWAAIHSEPSAHCHFNIPHSSFS